jgi:uncharacterized protein (DUF1330 family)
MKKGYCIVLLDVADQDLYAEYVVRATETETSHGGRALVAADVEHVAEGEWPAERIIVLEFPSLERARAWYSDPRYAELVPLRQKATQSVVLFVEGFLDED